MSSSYDDEIKVALTANAAQLEEGVAEATASIKGMQQTVVQEAAAFNAAVQTKVDAMVRLNAAFSGNVATTAGMAEAELALDQAMAAGAVTTGEYAAYVAQLDAAEAAMTATATAATAAMTEQAAALTLTGGVAREVGVMIGEVVRGNYTRLEGSTVTLMNRSGYLSTALNALMSPLGMVSLAAAGVAYEIFEAGQKFEAMEGTVLATGGAAGVTAGQLVGMAQRVAESTGDLTGAMEAMQKLSLTGRFAGHDLELVGQAAADMAALTGESIQTAVGQMVRLQEDPVKAVAKLNDQFHFLTLAQFDEIEAAEAAGDKQKAASLAYDAIATKMQGRTDELNTHVNILIKSWRELRNLWADSMLEVDHALGGGDDAYGLNEAKKLLDLLKKQEGQAKEMGSSALPGIKLQIEAQQKVVDDLTAKFKAAEEAAKKVGQAAQQTAKIIDGRAGADGGGSTSRDLEKDLRAKEAAEKISYDKREEFEAQYWQNVLSTSKEGSDEYIAAWQHVQSAQQQLDRQQEESWTRAQRQRAEAARQATRDVIQAFELERTEAQQGSQQRIAIDAQMMDRIAQMEGENSADFKRALTQRLADTKAFVDQAIAEHKREQAEVEKVYKADAEAGIKSINEVFSTRSKDAQEQYRLHQITSDQEIAILRDSADRQLQVERDILERYKELMAERPRVVSQINKQIDELETQHNQRIAQINNQASQQNAAMWNSRLQPITNAFNQSIAGMIQGTQTLQQGVSRLLQSILLSYIQLGIQSAQHWVVSEIIKTSATASGAAERTTIEGVAAAESKAISATTARTDITNAAAQAGAKAYQAVVGIPIIGPILAPAAAAVAFAGVEAFGGDVASASGGWERVPADDAPALLHRNEMVLPANLAERVRGMTEGGGQGGSQVVHQHNYHFQTPDARSFEQWLRRGGGTALARYAAGAGKNSPLTRT